MPANPYNNTADPKKLPKPLKRKKYAELRKEGWTNGEAAGWLGISRSTGNNWAKKYGLTVNKKDVTDFKDFPDPKPYSELSKDAKKGIEDFLYFCTHFLENPKKKGSFLDAPPYWAEMAGAISDPEMDRLIITIHPGAGKALALDTPIKTPSGWKTMKELEVGDQVYDESGKPCNVTYKSPVFYNHDCYRVSTDDGTSVIADGDHLWPVEVEGYRPERHRGGTRKLNGVIWPYPESPRFRLKTTRELDRSFHKRPRLPVAAPLEAPDQELPIDPYVLGLWLGDGTTTQASFTAAPEDAVFFRAQIEAAGYRTTDRKDPLSFGTNGLSHLLTAMDLFGNKHIPDSYFNASPCQRLALLQGLIDTDGSVSRRGMIEFSSCLPHLAEGVQYLVRSLGVKANLSRGKSQLNGVRYQDRYRVTFYLADAARLPRKRERCRNATRTTSRYLTVEPVESVPTQCIAVDSPSRLYLAGEGLIVTHNTWGAVSYILWRITRERAKGNKAFSVLYGSGTDSIASEALRLLNGWAASEVLIQAYGRYKPVSDDETEKTWTKRNIVVAGMGAGKGSTLSVWTITGKIRGVRPDLMIWDDPQSSDDATPDQTESLVYKWDSEIEDRIEPGGKIAVIGTYAGPVDLQHELLKRTIITEDGTQEPVWTQIRFPAHDESKCGGPGNHGQYPDGCLLWPERKSYRSLLDTMQNKELIWKLQWQLEDVPAGEVLVPHVWITGGQIGMHSYPGCLDENREMWWLPPDLSENAVMLATLDPSPTQWSAFELWVWDDPKDYLIAFERLRLRGDEEYAQVIKEWTTRAREPMPFDTWVVERTGAIYLHDSRAFNSLIEDLGISFIRHETTKQTKRDQQFGIWSWRDQFKHGRARLPYAPGPTQEAMKIFIDEHSRFPFHRTDDSPHATWFFNFHKRGIVPANREPIVLRRPSWIRQHA